jgi:AcrR family transcriptional regulator
MTDKRSGPKIPADKKSVVKPQRGKAKGAVPSDGEPELGWQAQKARETRGKILNAVISIIQEGGFGSASSSKIAERAGITWGAVQHHFGAKEDILRAILDLSHEKFIALTSDEAIRQGSMADRVDRFVDAMWLHYQSDLYLAALEILLASRGVSQVQESIMAMRDAHLTMLRATFPASVLSDDDILEALIFAHCVLTGLSIEGVLEKTLQNLDRHKRRIKFIMLSMLDGL